jgi:hypothetical protein
MKALSLRQPYAELVVSGRKTIELRTWNTSIRGEVFIHASLNTDKDAMARFGFTKLPTGCVVGKVKIIDVKHYLDEAAHTADGDKHMANSTWGTYGFVLVDAQRVETIPAKGALGFWDAKDIQLVTFK